MEGKSPDQNQDKEIERYLAVTQILKYDDPSQMVVC